jgi:hypothetical protein
VSDHCEFCGRTFMYHNATTHEFIPSARAQDEASSRGPALKQGALASTLPQPSGDLLESLREERGKRIPGNMTYVALLAKYRADRARFLDVAIGLGEAVEVIQTGFTERFHDPADAANEAAYVARIALTAAKKTWEEGR